MSVQSNNSLERQAESYRDGLNESLTGNNRIENAFNEASVDEEPEPDGEYSFEDDVYMEFHDLVSTDTGRSSYSVELKNPRRHEKVTWK